MKFGFSLLGLSPRWYAETARAVEELCFDSVWVQDHVVFPAELPSTYPYSADGSVGFGPETPLLDPWIALTTIANATTNVRLGSNIYILPLRSPFVTAGLPSRWIESLEDASSWGQELAGLSPSTTPSASHGRAAGSA